MVSILVTSVKAQDVLLFKYNAECEEPELRLHDYTLPKTEDSLGELHMHASP